MRWIISENMNVKHLLDAFTSIDANPYGFWDACACFIRYICCLKDSQMTIISSPDACSTSRGYVARFWPCEVQKLLRIYTFQL